MSTVLHAAGKFMARNAMPNTAFTTIRQKQTTLILAALKHVYARTFGSVAGVLVFTMEIVKILGPSRPKVKKND